VSRRGGHLLTRARSPSSNNGLPVLRLLPDAPVPDGRTVLTTPDATLSLEAVVGHGEHPPPFIRDTNQIESLNSVVRKAVRVRGHFPDDESARKLVYLAIRNHESTWKRPMAGRYECLAGFHAHFQDRLTRHS
jgi:Transposase, Mutator family